MKLFCIVFGLIWGMLLSSMELHGQVGLDAYLNMLPPLDVDPKRSNREQFQKRNKVEITYSYERVIAPASAAPLLVPRYRLKQIDIPDGGPPGYAWAQYLRDPEGRPLLQAYTDNSGNLMSGPYGWAARLCSYSPSGQLTAITYLGTDKKPVLVRERPIDMPLVPQPTDRLTTTGTVDKSSRSPSSTTAKSTEPVASHIPSPAGYATMQFSYDAARRISKITFYNETGEKTNNEQGYAEERFTYGEPRGSLVRKSYFDKDGRPVRLAAGYHAIVFDYMMPARAGQLKQRAEQVVRSNTISKQFFDLSKSLIGYVGIPTLAMSTQLERVHYLDEQNKPAKHILGHHQIQMNYDRSGKLTKISWLDDNKRNIANAWGFAALRCEQETTAQRIVCLDTLGHPVICSGGFAYQVVEYGADGLLARVDFLAEDGQTLVPGPQGWARQLIATQQLKNRETRVEITYYGSNAKPVLGPDAYHLQRLDFDRSGNLIREAFEGIGETPVFGPDGYASAEYTYNKSGQGSQLFSIAYFDTEHSPCLNKYGYAQVYHEYDAQGTCRKQVFCNTNGAIGTTPWPFATIVIGYNNRGFEISRKYQNAQGKPCYGPERAASIVRDYDTHGRLVSVSYKNARGQDALTPGGYASMHWTYARDGVGFTMRSRGGAANPSSQTVEGYSKRVVARVVNQPGVDYSEKFFNSSDSPAMIRGLYSVRHVSLTPNGRPGKERFFDSTGKEVAGVRMIYPGLVPPYNAMDATEETARRQYLKAPDKPMERFSPFRSQLTHVLYGPEAAPTCLEEVFYPSLLDRIPVCIASNEPTPAFNQLGQLESLSYPKTTTWNCTTEQFVYNSDGLLVKRILSTPPPAKHKRSGSSSSQNTK